PFAGVPPHPGTWRWEIVDDLAATCPDKQKPIDSLKKDVRGQGLDWDHDLKPALGSEADIVWLDLANGGQNIVALMKPDDEGAFARTIKRSNAKDPTNKVLYEKFHGWMLISDK